VNNKGIPPHQNVCRKV